MDVVATEEDRIAGFAIMEYGVTRAHLTLLAVPPAHRRQGVGTKLLAWHEEAALAAGIEATGRTCSPSAPADLADPPVRWVLGKASFVQVRAERSGSPP